MNPIITEQNFTEAQLICQKLVESMQSLDVKSAMTGLAMTLVFACDSADVPLESVFQMCREFRKGFQAMQKERDAAETVAPGKIIVP